MDDEIRAIVEAERERNHVAIRKRDNRLRRARAQAERLAAELANIDPAVREVWLFGSVARDSPGQEQFDIVELENVSARFREMVRRTGVRLYGSDG
jgi:predicted nucleotidyltransferase